MKLTVLGSCTVVDLPEQLDMFFRGDNLVDVRNGCRMEMDSVPLYFYARANDDEELIDRVEKGIRANLSDSKGTLWTCGAWGFDEVHLRFTSIALRFLTFEAARFDQPYIDSCFDAHVSHRESAFGGQWFFHDSLETDKLPYYRAWTGVDCGNASANNMVILNTHVDTLVTLLIARHYNAIDSRHDQLIQEAFTALKQFYSETDEVSGFPAWIDRTLRNIVLNRLGKRDIASRIWVQVITRLYYNRVRLWYKKRRKIRQFSDGYWERDLRLTGPSYAYHVVNVWDSCKLLLWMRYTGRTDLKIEQDLRRAIEMGLSYCNSSKAFTRYMESVGDSRGISNELLEAIAIAAQLGIRPDYLARLYFSWRKFAPPSVGLQGWDLSISGRAADIMARPSSVAGCIDWIPFEQGRIFVATDETPCDVPGTLELEWLQTVSGKQVNTDVRTIPVHTIAILKEKL